MRLRSSRISRAPTAPLPGRRFPFTGAPPGRPRRCWIATEVAPQSPPRLRTRNSLGAFPRPQPRPSLCRNRDFSERHRRRWAPRRRHLARAKRALASFPAASRQATLHADAPHAGYYPGPRPTPGRNLGPPRGKGPRPHAIAARPRPLTPSSNPQLGAASHHQELHRCAIRGFLGPHSDACGGLEYCATPIRQYSIRQPSGAPVHHRRPAA